MPGKLDAIRAELAQVEAELTLQSRQLQAMRQDLPWRPADDNLGLAALFGSCRQLVVYHFRHDHLPTGKESAPDVFHTWLSRNDVAMVAASDWSQETATHWASERDWPFPCVLSDQLHGRFHQEAGVADPRLPILSTFVLHDGRVFHTYSVRADNAPMAMTRRFAFFPRPPWKPAG